MKRVFDFILSLVMFSFLLIPMLAIGIIVRLTSKGPALYWSERIGAHNNIFQMPKFRTMKINTPVVATHLLTSANECITPIGKFLRKFSLDELPQLWNILRGDMSFVGPRPALFNQDDLIDLRVQKGVHVLTPGLTGWAQINGRDELSIEDKVSYDKYYLEHHSFLFDIKVFFMTVWRVFKKDGVCH